MARSINLTMPTPKIELVDSVKWNLTEAAITALPKAIKRGYDKGVDKFSKRLLKIIQGAIQSGNPPPGSGVTWAPLKRGKHIYYKKGAFSRAIRVYKYKSRTLVGMPLKMNHYGGLTYTQLATLLEYGNDTIPSRPLWRPALSSAGGPKECKRILIKEIRSSIISLTGIRANQIKVKW